MKTIKKDGNVERVSDAKAEEAVKNGWSYCPKAEWKVIRGPVTVKNEPSSNKKAKKNKKAQEIVHEDTSK